MAFTTITISNWVQHQAQDGACLRCGRLLNSTVSGIVYAKDGDEDILLCEPITNWTVCA